jgi:hypothetical protein
LSTYTFVICWIIAIEAKEDPPSGEYNTFWIKKRLWILRLIVLGNSPDAATLF